MPLKSGDLTPQEKSFAQHMALTGDPRYAAEKAGYRRPHEAGTKTLRKQGVNAEIAALCAAELHNELRPLANRRLRTILENDDIAPQHHIAAAKVVIGACKDAVDPISGKPVDQMTPDELQAAISRVELLIGKGDAETLEPVSIEPDPGVFG